MGSQEAEDGAFEVDSLVILGQLALSVHLSHYLEWEQPVPGGGEKASLKSQLSRREDGETGHIPGAELGRP